MKKITLFIGIALLSTWARGQQVPQYTQYMYNMNTVNPAYAGSSEGLVLNFLTRTQWAGIEGAPKTLTLGIHSPVGKNVGLGFTIISDKIGPVNEQMVYGDFSYTLTLNNNHKLAFGLKGGFTFFNVNLSKLNLLESSDPAFLNNNINTILPNLGLGAYYYTDKFYAGVSIPNLLETFQFEKRGGQITSTAEIRHYFLTTGMVFDLTNNIKFKPSSMLKIVTGAPMSIDLPANFLFNERFELGVSHRFNESVSALFNVRASRSLRVGYSYDHTITNLGNFNSGSHEVFILFNFNSGRNRIWNPRFF